jgi:hypothetical protein
MESINGSDIVKSNFPTGIVAILFSGWVFSVTVILLPPHFNSIIGADIYTSSAAIYAGASFLKDVRFFIFRKADSFVVTYFCAGSAARALLPVDMGQVLCTTSLQRATFHKTSKKKSGVYP